LEDSARIKHLKKTRMGMLRPTPNQFTVLITYLREMNLRKKKSRYTLSKHAEHHLPVKASGDLKGYCIPDVRVPIPNLTRNV